jgi:tRNA nucleotidyltransferase/poly(A) polymerase
MSDYNFLMESRFSPEQLQVLNFLSRVAAAQGLNFYLAGGAVRDLVQGQQVVHDLDFVVEGNIHKILRHLEDELPAKHAGGALRQAADHSGKTVVEHVTVGKRLNEAELRFASGVRAKIASSRNETYSRAGRAPEIVPAMIFDDLKRRDFSANAMAISLHPNSRGLLLDPTNGSADISQREFRVLHSRSFLEDPSRIYRLLRLSLRLDFKPEERTRVLLQSALDNRVWEQTEPDKQGRELRAILEEENPARILKLLIERGLLAGLDKKIASTKIPYDQFGKIRAAVRSVPGADGLLLNFHCLVEKLGGADRVRLAKKILRDPATVKAALNIERDARALARLLSGSKAAKNSYVYTLLSESPLHVLLFLLLYYPQPKIQSRVKGFLFKFPQLHANLPISELEAMGMPRGPKFDKIMEQVFMDELDAKIRGRQQVTAELRALSGIKEPAPKPVNASAAKSRLASPAAAPARSRGISVKARTKA